MRHATVINRTPWILREFSVPIPETSQVIDNHKFSQTVVWIPNGLTLVAQILKISAAYTPPPPEGFISPERALESLRRAIELSRSDGYHLFGSHLDLAQRCRSPDSG